MRRLAFGLLGLAACLLGSCSPIRTAPDNDPAALRLIQEPSSLYFWLGDIPAFDVTLTIFGTSLRANAPTWCKPDQGRILCNIPTIPAGKNFVLPLTGSNISAVARYKRQAGGQEFVRRTQ